MNTKQSIIYSILIFLSGMGLMSWINCFEEDKPTKIVWNHVIVNEDRDFTKEKLVEEIDKYNFRFPHIVYAQALQETGHFTSDNFSKHNNVFGMKVAKSRITTAKKHKETIHATYNDWQESVIDRALFETTFMRQLKTEAEYYNYLDRNYAEDKTYENKLKKLAKEYEKIKASKGTN